MPGPTKNDKLLLDAVLSKDYKETKLLLSIGANPNHLFDDEGGISAFHIAVGVGNLQLIKLFLQSEANVNLKCNKLGWTPMHVCAYWNRPDALELLLQQKSADPFKLCNNQRTVLETAISNRSLACVSVMEDYFRSCNQAQIVKRCKPFSNKGSFDSLATADSILNSTSASEFSEISLLNTKNPEDFSHVITSTFNEMDFTSQQPAIIPLPILDKTITISSSYDRTDCIPVPKQRKSRKPVEEEPTKDLNDLNQQKRFHSPPNLPAFYSNLLINKEKIETKSTETQTTNKCVLIKKSELIKSKSPQSKSTESVDESEQQTTVVSSIKKWLINKFTSPVLNRSNCHDFQAELENNHQFEVKRQSRESSNKSKQIQPRYTRASSLASSRQSAQCENKCNGPEPQTRNKNNYNNNNTNTGSRARSQELIYNRQKAQAPVPPIRKQNDPEISTFVNLNDIISDHIGTVFFQNVLGKSDSIQSMSKIIKQDKTPKKPTPMTIRTRAITPAKQTPEPIKQKKTVTPSQHNQKENKSPQCISGTIKKLPSNPKLVRSTNQQPIPSPREDYSRFSTSNSVTLTPKTSDSDLDNTLEEYCTKYPKKKHSIITLDDSEDTGSLTDDLSSSERKSTSTKALEYQVEKLAKNLNRINIRAGKLDEEVVKTTTRLRKSSVPKPVVVMTGYSNELMLQLDNRLNLTTTSDIMVSNMFECFGESPVSSGQSEWREGHIKSAFNYVLIDPRISRNLPLRAKKGMEPMEVLKVFVESIFYIGKGSRARPYAHLHDTLRVWKANTPISSSTEKMPKKSKKISRIIDIWEENMGVVSLHIFQSVIPCEAYTREAAMIDAIGIHNLTNIKKGNYYGAAKNWKQEYKCKLGTILLKKACAIFLAEGERQIKPEDI